MTEHSRFNAIDADGGVPSGQPTYGSLSDAVWDRQALYDRCMGNLDLLQRVLDRFEERLPEELAELERVLERGEAAKTALVAHRIRGSASNVSAAGLQQAAAEIEELSRAGRLADIPTRLQDLREEWQRYVDCRAAFQPSAADAVGHGLTPPSRARTTWEASS